MRTHPVDSLPRLRFNVPMTNAHTLPTATDYSAMDDAAAFIIGSGYSRDDAFVEMMRRFPNVPTSILAERVAAAWILR